MTGAREGRARIGGPQAAASGDVAALRWVRILDGRTALTRQQLGGKAYSINWMRTLGLAVPPAATLITEAHAALDSRGELPAAVWAEIREAIAWLEQHTGRTFGGGPRPLLVSVRSGAAESMPGMMDTILNLGINDHTSRLMAADSGNEDFARETLGLFREQYRRQIGGGPGNRPSALAAAGDGVPEDVWAQLEGAVDAVLASWNSPRARAYRQHYQLDERAGTSVTIQAMVFGNFPTASGSGVLFSRNPGSGEAEPYGQWLPCVQGEDIVSGRRDPEPIATLARAMPALYQELVDAAGRLEAEARDVQDIEFTIERGRLWLLQARSAKRSPRAAVNFAVQLAEQGLISRSEALTRVTAGQVRQLLRPGLDASALLGARVVASGEPACPGLAHGTVVTSADDALDREAEGVVLARPTTSPDDIHGMLAARAIVTELGGATSHAAVVSREIGVPCIVGCGQGALLPLAGQAVTVDGASGQVYAGNLPVVRFSEDGDPGLATLIAWAAALSPLKVLGLDEPAAAGAVDTLVVDAGLAGRLGALALEGAGAKGAAMETPEGIREAVAVGLGTVFVSQRLPALLAAIRACSPA
jgi:pyruvate,orthophosphate dikinase